MAGRKLAFTKMHGCANDYLYFNCFEAPVEDPEALAVRLSPRHTGVGGDGVVLIGPSRKADAEMRMFNSDGSEGKMCGNAIRCVSKFLWDNRLARKELLRIETLSGVKECRVHVRDGEVDTVTVDMGRALLSPKDIPVRLPGERVVERAVRVAGGTYRITCVSLGNPHCVVFGGDPGLLDLEALGPAFEHDPLFPERVNTEFVQAVDSRTLKMRVWERGSGETMACGTGACAAAVAAVLSGRCPKDEEMLVRLRGGDLGVRCTEKTVWMTGEARKVFEGVVEY